MIEKETNSKHIDSLIKSINYNIMCDSEELFVLDRRFL